jgi:hypothetical protein
MDKESLEILKDEIAMADYDPLWLVEQGFMWIKTKDAKLVRFVPNTSQKKLLKVIRAEMDKGKPVKIWVLKYRQGGVSTLAEAIISAFTMQRQNTNALVIADIKDHTNNLYEMFRLYCEKMQELNPHLIPDIKKSNDKNFEFERTRSKIILGTAENPKCAKSGTFQLVHLSEVAFFRDYHELMGDLMQTVPDIAGSLIIGETTANGRNFFYDEWSRAIGGKTSWIPVFLAWFEMDEYSLEVENGEQYPIDEIDLGDKTVQEFLEEEQRLAQKYKLNEHQINWRRYAIVNKCQGKLSTFYREYPSCWQEAFSESGSTFFNRKGIEFQQETEEEPFMVGEIFRQDGRWSLKPKPLGRVKVYTEPEEHHQYIVTGDTSEALGHDEASLYVVDKQTNDTVAVCNGQYPPEDLADLAIRLGNYYNEAMIAIENKSYGYMANQLVAKNYGNIYRKKNTKKGYVEDTEELGFNTNSVTRPLMLARMAEEVREQSSLYKDKDLIAQLWMFVVDPKTKKAEAQAGDQDGLVICRAIASQVRVEHPFVREHGVDWTQYEEDGDYMAC